MFLHHYLTLMLADEVNAGRLFTTFRDWVATGTDNAARHMARFREYADVYRSMEEFGSVSREGVFMYRMDALDTTTFFPLLLELFKRYRGHEHRDELERILVDLESYLVRRTVCELTTKNYNGLVVSLIRHLRSSDDYSSSAIRSFLLSQEADTFRWPDDTEFRTAWLNVMFYKLKRAKARMMLEALEEASHTGKTEKVHIEKKLTIEHLLPVSWERHWPLVTNAAPTEQVDKLAERRNELLHRVGNLTLLTRELNPSVSNGPWPKKREEILKHSALNLNRPFRDVHTWNEGGIEERSALLFNSAQRIWPRHAGTAAAGA